MGTMIDFARPDGGGTKGYLPVASGYNYPAGRSVPATHFNFFSDTVSAFYYPYALFSAGIAGLTPGGSLKTQQQSMVYDRDKSKTTVLTDSGGYQIATQKPAGKFINFDNRRQVARMQKCIYDWQMATGDMGVIIDIPLIATTKPSKKWFKTADDCLNQTVKNIQFLFDNYPDRTHRFLNVMQARNDQELIDWYNAVRNFDLEGWAVGGDLKANFYLLLKLMIWLRDNKELERGERDWIHMFGTGIPIHALHYTQIKRCINKFNPNLKLTYDTASYSRMGGIAGTIYEEPAALGFRSPDSYPGPMLLDPSNTPRTTDVTPEALWMGSHDEWFETGEKGQWFELANSPVLKDLDFTDFIVKDSGTGWDNVSYALAMMANLYTTIYTIHWGHMQYDRQLKRGVPDFAKVKEMNDLIIEIFDSSTPDTLLTAERPFLENY